MAEFKHIVRVANTDLKGEKHLLIAMTKIKGVSIMFSNMALGLAKVSKTKKAGDLEDKEVERINDVLLNPLKYKVPKWMFNRNNDYDSGEDMHLLNADLTFTKDNDLKRLKKIKSYRGLRHQWGLPVRGQKTKSNFRRQKGKGLGVKRKTSVRK
ncbi:30S ribosomal protein S13 [Candidatus Woesearchaeota archaeon]|nr:30S ribosomal protein S13 [Candidatus Woesearchaeota archaeon]MCF7901631.1 30S ribosomal protein S13 [Candidatus Woesearchaeota archaeon]MCF8012991.1 30S ribosomal protein S13 [Candidatus Woesearchaeota archaeon]